MPFKTIGYYDPTKGILSPTYLPNSTPFYVKDIKYPTGNSSEPITLAYASPSLVSNNPGLFFGVLIYKVNHNFAFDNNQQNNSSKNATEINSGKATSHKPASTTTAKTTQNNATAAKVAKTTQNNATAAKTTQNNATISAANNKSNITSNNNISSHSMATNKTSNTADIETTQGQIKIQFFPNQAPNHVKNFINLADKGFYDGTIFHRIVKGFVIQGGDPNTKNDSNKEAWGTGGPGYTVNAEFNNISHDRGIVSMALTAIPIVQVHNFLSY